MAKRVILSKIYSDGIERKTEKDCNTETEMRKCFDECVKSFEEFCKRFGAFVKRDYRMASGEAMGITFAVMVVNSK